jgi:dTDP-4-amino-4,6-dideoxygalactose transaminase
MKPLAINGGTPTRSKDNFLIFGSPLIEEPEIEEVVACMRRRWIGTGPKVHQFEEDFKRTDAFFAFLACVERNRY